MTFPRPLGVTPEAAMKRPAATIGEAYDRAENGEDCPRFLALYARGTRIEGVKHRPHYAGKVPNTGPIMCALCGEEM